MTDLQKDFINSVKDLSSKLPQWNSEDKNRVIHSTLASMFEELGEISGAISKYRLRSKNGVDYYYTPPKETPNYDEIRQKFIDEIGDFVWVLTASVLNNVKEQKYQTMIFNKLMEEKDNNSVSTVSNEQDMITKSNDKYLNMHTALFDIIRDVVLLYQTYLFNDFDFDKYNFNRYLNIVSSFNLFFIFVSNEYDITFNDILTYNISKLGKRYTSTGKRVDGK